MPYGTYIYKFKSFEIEFANSIHSIVLKLPEAKTDSDLKGKRDSPHYVRGSCLEQAKWKHVLEPQHANSMVGDEESPGTACKHS